MKIYLIRHAQAQHNVVNNTGLFDPEITELGKNQCQNTKNDYSDANIVLSSTSTRALQTTSFLFDNIPFFATDLLLEYNTGASCNSRHNLNHQKEKFPNINFDKYLTQELQIETTWQHGEERAKKVIELLKMFNEPVLAVVSHANFIRNIMALIKNYDSNELDNCNAHIVYL